MVVSVIAPVDVAVHSHTPVFVVALLGVAARSHIPVGVAAPLEHSRALVAECRCYTPAVALLHIHKPDAGAVTAPLDVEEHTHRPVSVNVRPR